MRDQTSVSELKVFGIDVSTRYGIAAELAEMINFCLAVASAGLERRVRKVFYDSKSCCCTFELASSVKPYDETDRILQQAALCTISQFEWNGVVEHGKSLDLSELHKMTHSS